MELLARSHRITKLKLVLQVHTTTVHLPGGGPANQWGSNELQRSCSSQDEAGFVAKLLHIQIPKAKIPFGSIKVMLLDFFFFKCKSSTEVLFRDTEIFIHNYN